MIQVKMTQLLTGIHMSFPRIPFELNHVDRLLVIVIVIVGFRVDRVMVIVRAVSHFMALHSPLGTDVVARHCVSCNKLRSIC